MKPMRLDRRSKRLLVPLLLIGTMPLTACSTLGTGKAVDSALCGELKFPIDVAVNTTIEYADRTPPQVINDWTTVVKGFDAGCK